MSHCKSVFLNILQLLIDRNKPRIVPQQDELSDDEDVDVDVQLGPKFAFPSFPTLPQLNIPTINNPLETFWRIYEENRPTYGTPFSVRARLDALYNNLVHEETQKRQEEFDAAVEYRRRLNNKYFYVDKKVDNKKKSSQRRNNKDFNLRRRRQSLEEDFVDEFQSDEELDDGSNSSLDGEHEQEKVDKTEEFDKKSDPIYQEFWSRVFNEDKTMEIQKPPRNPFYSRIQLTILDKIKVISFRSK
jgi:hypothetical protein